MDSEEERVLYLTRVGRDKIFKYGTYTMTKERAITQDHPFYAKREEEPVEEPVMDSAPAQAGVPAMESGPVMDSEPVDPEALAGQIISSNFKVGLSQEEVDALLNGM